MLQYHMREQDRIREILSSLPPEQRLFRINSGMGWAGKVARRDPDILILEKPRPLHAAPEGWPDLCGWTEIEITPDMVGRKIAVFTAVEVKVTGNLSKAQKAFQRVIEGMGGRYVVDSGK
jgi:hypothetical protein